MESLNFSGTFLFYKKKKNEYLRILCEIHKSSGQSMIDMHKFEKYIDDDATYLSSSILYIISFNGPGTFENSKYHQFRTFLTKY